MESNQPPFGKTRGDTLSGHHTSALIEVRIPILTPSFGKAVTDILHFSHSLFSCFSPDIYKQFFIAAANAAGFSQAMECPAFFTTSTVSFRLRNSS